MTLIFLRLIFLKRKLEFSKRCCFTVEEIKRFGIKSMKIKYNSILKYYDLKNSKLRNGFVCAS